QRQKAGRKNRARDSIHCFPGHTIVLKRIPTARPKKALIKYLRKGQTTGYTGAYQRFPKPRLFETKSRAAFFCGLAITLGPPYVIPVTAGVDGSWHSVGVTYAWLRRLRRYCQGIFLLVFVVLLLRTEFRGSFHS